MASKPTYTAAKDVLNATDLARLACCYFHMDTKNIDYQAAADDFGAASANSFRVMIGSAMKKIRDAQDGKVAPETPKKEKKSSAAQKRKAVHGDDHEAETPKAKKRLVPAKEEHDVLVEVKKELESLEQI